MDTLIAGALQQMERWGAIDLEGRVLYIDTSDPGTIDIDQILQFIFASTATLW